MLCPRCQHDQEDGLEECRACGVVFSRYRPRPLPPPPERSWLWERMFLIESGAGRGLVALRGVLLLALGLLTLGFLLAPMRGPAPLGGFLHMVDLPFHEAGHVVFSPLGAFLHILGGTLGQLLVPVVVAAAFLKEENAFGGSVGAWWLGQNFVDCVPYIADARVRVLLLTSGETGQTDWEGHDWYQLLSRTGTLAHDIRIATLAWVVGMAIMLAALAWGVYILRRQWEPGTAGTD